MDEITRRNCDTVDFLVKKIEAEEKKESEIRSYNEHWNDYYGNDSNFPNRNR